MKHLNNDHYIHTITFTQDGVRAQYKELRKDAALRRSLDPTHVTGRQHRSSRPVGATENYMRMLRPQDQALSRPQPLGNRGCLRRVLSREHVKLCRDPAVHLGLLLPLPERCLSLPVTLTLPLSLLSIPKLGFIFRFLCCVQYVILSLFLFSCVLPTTLLCSLLPVWENLNTKKVPTMCTHYLE